jgi:hypothetical protein
MGTEEISQITPGINRLRRKGWDVIGPLPADTLFEPRIRAGYDLIVSMYHDQALTALKAQYFDRLVINQRALVSCSMFLRLVLQLPKIVQGDNCWWVTIVVPKMARLLLFLQRRRPRRLLTWKWPFSMLLQWKNANQQQQLLLLSPMR